MIVTVTPAPAIDWTIEVGSFELGVVNRAISSSREASGKGVNISWALHRAGRPTRAVLPAGGTGGQLIAQALTRAGIDHVIVPTDRDVRINVTLLTPGDSTKINEPGAEVSADHLAQLRQAVVTSSEDAAAVLLCGSLPAGVPTTFLRDLAQLLADRPAQVVVDSSGEPLERALAARPDLIKPNVDELADLTGRSISTMGDVVQAAQAARDRGARAVLASLGPDGALLVDGDEVLHASARDIPFVNSVGAGDALLAGFFGGGEGRTERLAMAMLWASSAVAHRTTLFPVLDSLAANITVGPLTDHDRRLVEPSAPLARVHR